MVIKFSQSTESNKFAISLQYLKTEVRNGVHFLQADKHHFLLGKLLQVGIIVFDGSFQTCPNYQK